MRSLLWAIRALAAAESFGGGAVSSPPASPRAGGFVAGPIAEVVLEAHQEGSLIGRRKL